MSLYFGQRRYLRTLVNKMVRCGGHSLTLEDKMLFTLRDYGFWTKRTSSSDEHTTEVLDASDLLVAVGMSADSSQEATTIAVAGLLQKEPA